MRLSLAGFQVIMYGRFWVITEALEAEAAGFQWQHCDRTVRSGVPVTSKIPVPGTENDDLNPARVWPRHQTTEHLRWTLLGEILRPHERPAEVRMVPALDARNPAC
jgi:hypothetical protein